MELWYSVILFFSNPNILAVISLHSPFLEKRNIELFKTNFNGQSWFKSVRVCKGRGFVIYDIRLRSTMLIMVLGLTKISRVGNFLAFPPFRRCALLRFASPLRSSIIEERMLAWGISWIDQLDNGWIFLFIRKEISDRRAEYEETSKYQQIKNNGKYLGQLGFAHFFLKNRFRDFSARPQKSYEAKKKSTAQACKGEKAQKLVRLVWSLQNKMGARFLTQLTVGVRHLGDRNFSKRIFFSPG